MSKQLSVFITVVFTAVTVPAVADEDSMADAKPTVSVRSAQIEKMEYCHKESGPSRVDLEAAIELCSEIDETGNKICREILVKQAELKAFVRSCLMQEKMESAPGEN